jgi:hypothetical protein
MTRHGTNGIHLHDGSVCFRLEVVSFTSINVVADRGEGDLSIANGLGRADVCSIGTPYM